MAVLMSAYRNKGCFYLLFGLFLPAYFLLSTGIALAQPSWEEMATAYAGAGRANHAMAYDSDRGVVVMFGGRKPGVYHYSDTWEWDGTQWAQVSISGPEPRYGHALAYDANKRRVVLFGGKSYVADPTEDVYYSDTWTWDGSSWTKMPTSGPSARYAHAMAYDSSRKVVVLYGGETWSYGISGAVWEWNGTSWSKRGDFDSPGPVPRYAHAMAYDSDRNVIVMHGGKHQSGDNSLSTWEWDGNNWTLRSSVGPAKRCWHAMAYDSNRKRIVVFGGWRDGDRFNDTWEWDGIGWGEVFPAPGDASPPASTPSRRWGHAMAYDSANRKIVLFGGSGISDPINYLSDAENDTWLYGPPGGDKKSFDLFVKLAKAAPKTVSPGGQISLIARIKNKGPDTSLACRVYFYLSPDKGLDTTDILMGTADLSGINNKKSKRLKKKALIPVTLGKGDYYAVAEVNIADAKETNNVKASQKTVRIN
jgi:hypothetical protein